MAHLAVLRVLEGEANGDVVEALRAIPLALLACFRGRRSRYYIEVLVGFIPHERGILHKNINF